MLSRHAEEGLTGAQTRNILLLSEQQFITMHRSAVLKAERVDWWDIIAEFNLFFIDSHI